MSATLSLLSLDAKILPLYLAAQQADAAFWALITSEDFKAGNKGDYITTEALQKQTDDAWYAARVAMSRDEQLPILEASHRDTEPCALTQLFKAGEHFTITVTDGNIQELADAWEDSNRRRTFSTGRGKGTVMSWLLAHRGKTVTLGS